MVFCKIRKKWQMPGTLMLFLGFLMFTVSVLSVNTAFAAEAQSFGERAKSMSEIMAIRISNSPDKTRIVVDCTKEVTFKTSTLANPSRVVIDIGNAWLNPVISKSLNIDSRFAKRMRIAQYDPTAVRVVVESTMGKNNVKIFPLKGGAAGYRVVMDFGNLQTGTSGSTIDFNPKPKQEKPVIKDPTTAPSPNTSTNTGTNTNTENSTVESNSSGNGTVDSRDTQAQQNKKNNSEKVMTEPVFTPGLAGKVIAVDAGHGGSDVGAIGPTGVTEKNITLRIAQELQKQLQQAGAKVLMTRTTDTEVSQKGERATDIEELQARCDVANNGKADIFISIHMDSFSNSSPNGTTGYYYGGGTKSGQRLSKLVSENVSASLSTGNRGNKSCNFYVVKHTTMPATLLETAFISNQKEERLLNSVDGIKKAAAGIMNGLKAFFG